MSKSKRVGIVLAGGLGERLWPLSREDNPKQLLRLSHPRRSLLEETVDRLSDLLPADQIYVATHKGLSEIIRDTNVVPEQNVFAEPLRRNTLGATVWAVASLAARFPVGARGLSSLVIGLFTADHRIGNPLEYAVAIEAAFNEAEKGGIVTIGLPPARPETGFGYIQTESFGDGEVSKVVGFIEKPRVEAAQALIDSKSSLWNSGMAFFSADSFLAELDAQLPVASQAFHGLVSAIRLNDLAAQIALFETLPKLSLDYAVLEKAKDLKVVRGHFEWDDLGVWTSLDGARDADEEGNIIEGDALALDTKDSILYNDNPDAVLTVIGLERMIVVSTKDAVLVCPKDHAQRVREIVAALAKREGKNKLV